MDSGIEAIGFVFPVYMTAVPRPVADFICTVSLPPMDRYVFAIATHGGVPGKAGRHLYKLLRARKIGLDTHFQLEMVLN